MNKDFLKKIQESLDNGIVDESLQKKIEEIKYIGEDLTQEKIQNSNLKDIINLENKLIKEGYFKDKITEEDIEKSKKENEKFEKEFEIANKKSNIIDTIEDYKFLIKNKILELQVYLDDVEFDETDELFITYINENKDKMCEIYDKYFIK
jgi:hypothetical protein